VGAWPSTARHKEISVFLGFFGISPENWLRFVFHSEDRCSVNAAGHEWWVFHVRPRQEKSLARDLMKRQVPFYLPLISRRWRSKGRLMNSLVPLFPGYVFARTDKKERRPRSPLSGSSARSKWRSRAEDLAATLGARS
jgi:hypothetical protein